MLVDMQCGSQTLKIQGYETPGSEVSRVLEWGKRAAVHGHAGSLKMIDMS